MQDSSSFRKVTRDILDLCELQMQLLSVDSQAAKRELARAAGSAAAAATLAGSALTVALFGGSFLLHEQTSLSVGGALLTIGAVAFATVALLLLVAYHAARSAAAAMSETRSEFAENLRWLKATLISPESSPRNQFRSETFRESSDSGGFHAHNSESTFQRR